MTNNENILDLHTRVELIKNSMANKVDRNKQTLPISNLIIEGGLSIGTLGDIQEYLKLVSQINHGFMSKEDKIRLDNMEDNANHYIHPPSHSADMIDENSARRFVTDAQIADWDSKATGDHLHDDRYYTKTKTDELLDTKANVKHGNHVPDLQEANDLTYLRNDNTWFTIPDTSVARKGVVQLSDDENDTSILRAATINVVNKIMKALDGAKVNRAGDTINGTLKFDPSVDENYKDIIMLAGDELNKLSILKTYKTNLGNGLMLSAPNLGLALTSGMSHTYINEIRTDKDDSNSLFLSDSGFKFYSNLATGMNRVKEMIYDANGLLSVPSLRVIDGMEIPGLYVLNSSTFTYKGKNVIHEGNYNEFINPSAIDVYTKAESDARYVQIVGNTVPIGDKEFSLSKNISAPVTTLRRTRRSLDALSESMPITTSTVIHGGISISENGLDIKTNYTANIVINNDDIGDGALRVQYGSGRMNLVEINNEEMLWKNKYNILHTGILDPNNVAMKEHGNHVPEVQPADDTMFLRNDNKWSKITPNNIGALNTNGSNAMTNTLKITSKYGNYVGIKLIKGGEDETSQNYLSIGYATNEEPIFGYSSGGNWKRYIRLNSDNKLMFMSSQGSEEKEVFHKGNLGLATQSGTGLMSGKDKTKLDGIENNANNYIHPDKHDPDIISETEIKKFVSQEQINSWNAKAEAEHGYHVPTPDSEVVSNKFLRSDNSWQLITPDLLGAYNKNEIDNMISGIVNQIDWKEAVNSFDDISTTYPNPEDGWTVNVKDTNITYRYDGSSWIAISSNALEKATSAKDGLMSKEDKIKLDGVENGANRYVHPPTHDASEIVTNSDKMFVSQSQIDDWNSKSGGVHTHNASDIIESDLKKFVTSAQIEAWNNKAERIHNHDDLYYGKDAIDDKIRNHGNHVPATETPNNAKFLRNDNTWHLLTPDDINVYDKNYINEKINKINSRYNSSVQNITSLDNRSESLLPNQYGLGMGLEFKQSSVIGTDSAFGTIYSGLLTIRPYGELTDFTGGGVTQIAIPTRADKGLMIRYGTNHANNPWGSWRTIWDSGSFNPDNYYLKTAMDSLLDTKADRSHGNHIPAPEGMVANKFLRNDNSWQPITSEIIGALAKDGSNDYTGILKLLRNSPHMVFDDTRDQTGTVTEHGAFIGFGSQTLKRFQIYNRYTGKELSLAENGKLIYDTHEVYHTGNLTIPDTSQIYTKNEINNLLGNKADCVYLESRSTNDCNSAQGNGFNAKYVPPNANLKPEGIDHAMLTMAYNSQWFYQMAGDWRTGNLYLRGSDGQSNPANPPFWNKVWHSGLFNPDTKMNVSGGTFTDHVTMAAGKCFIGAHNYGFMNKKSDGSNIYSLLIGTDNKLHVGWSDGVPIVLDSRDVKVHGGHDVLHTGMMNPRDYKRWGRRTITIYGDENTYYPVSINLDSIPEAKIICWRGYTLKAPDSWNGPTHKGGLNITMNIALGGWGGMQYYVYGNVTQTYSKMIGDILAPSPATDHLVLLLRGGGTGGAEYVFESDIEINPIVHHGRFDNTHNSGGTTYPGSVDPISTPRGIFNAIDLNFKYSTVDEFKLGSLVGSTLGSQTERSAYMNRLNGGTFRAEGLQVGSSNVWHAGNFDPNSKANTSHGTHVPTPEGANNARFLRNDNTWQNITPGNIGAYTKGEIDSQWANGAKHQWYQGYSTTLSGQDVNSVFHHGKSGFFCGNDMGNQMPWGGHPWRHYYVTSHSNADGYTGIIGMNFNGDEIGFKAICVGQDKGWKRIWHHGNFDPNSKLNANAPHTGATFKSTYQGGNFAYAGQHTWEAPYYHTFDNGGGSDYHPIIKQRYHMPNIYYGRWSFGTLCTGSGDAPFVLHHISETGADQMQFNFHRSGTFSCPRVVNAVWNDYAELFPKHKGYETEPGDIIALDIESDKEVYVKATECTSKMVVGCHSDEYGHLLGGEKPPVDHPVQDIYEFNKDRFIPIGLAGRVRAKCIGIIKKGDDLVISDIPGVARAFDPNIDNPRSIFGMAVESKDDENTISRVKMFIRN